jgi:hypothetical protein
VGSVINWPKSGARRPVKEAAEYNASPLPVNPAPDSSAILAAVPAFPLIFQSHLAIALGWLGYLAVPLQDASLVMRPLWLSSGHRPDRLGFSQNRDEPRKIVSSVTLNLSPRLSYLLARRLLIGRLSLKRHILAARREAADHKVFRSE